MLAVPDLSPERKSQLLAIDDGTLWSADFDDGPYSAFLCAINDVHLNVEKGLGDYSTRVGPSQGRTEKGEPYFTLFNGKVKPEGEMGEQVVLDPPYTVWRQIEMIERLTAEMVAAIISLKPGLASTVVWRRFPAVERYLVPEGLAFKCSARLVWE